MTSESADPPGLCDKSIMLRKHRKHVFNKTGEFFCLFIVSLNPPAISLSSAFDRDPTSFVYVLRVFLFYFYLGFPKIYCPQHFHDTMEVNRG